MLVIILSKNAELLTMTYGAIVVQLLKDYKDPKVVNRELDNMCVFVCVFECVCVHINSQS